MAAFTFAWAVGRVCRLGGSLCFIKITHGSLRVLLFTYDIFASGGWLVKMRGTNLMRRRYENFQGVQIINNQKGVH